MSQRNHASFMPPLLLGLLLAFLGCKASPVVEEKGAFRLDHPGEAREFFRLKRAPRGKKDVPTERYLHVDRILEAMRRHSASLGLPLPSILATQRPSMAPVLRQIGIGAWEELGPGNIGGRTRALVIDKKAPLTMYTAGVAGGVWKTIDGGRSWSPLKDMMTNLGVASLAIDPSDRNVLYAGTGEGQAVDGIRGAGIFRTPNGGTDWIELKQTQNPDFYNVNAVVVSALDGKRVYAATGTGIWRSPDGGEHWTMTFNAKQNGGCLALALRTDRATDALLATCKGAPDRDSVWQNPKAEGSGKWQEVLSESGMGRISLAIAPSNQNIIYAVAARRGRAPDDPLKGAVLAVFRSSLGGVAGSWSARLRNPGTDPLGSLLLTNSRQASIARCKFDGSDAILNQGEYDNVIAVDPVNPDRVWIGGIDLFRSDDGGTNWGLASYWWFDSQATGYVHADQHAIVFHPSYDGRTNKTLFVSNDGGIYATADALAPTAKGPSAPCGLDSHFTWHSLNNGYRVTQFYHGVPYPDGTTYIGGTQDNGTLRGSDKDGKNSWTTLIMGDGGHVSIDPDSTDTIYAQYIYLSFLKSIDGGKTFMSRTNGIEAEGFLFIAPFAMDPSDRQRLWLGGQSLWTSDDGAESWRRASQPLTTGTEDAISAIAIAPKNSNLVLAGTSDGYIYRTGVERSTSGDFTWSMARPQEGFVSALAFDPVDPKIVYATYSNFELRHVWKSVDGGAKWMPIDGQGSKETTLPDIPVDSIVVDPMHSDHLYLGTDAGIFVSTDGGTTWAVENTGFANVITESLTLGKMPDGALALFAFTHGRGAWRVRLSEHIEPHRQKASAGPGER